MDRPARKMQQGVETAAACWPTTTRGTGDTPVVAWAAPHRQNGGEDARPRPFLPSRCCRQPCRRGTLRQQRPHPMASHRQQHTPIPKTTTRHALQMVPRHGSGKHLARRNPGRSEFRIPKEVTRPQIHSSNRKKGDKVQEFHFFCLHLQKNGILSIFPCILWNRSE